MTRKSAVSIATREAQIRDLDRAHEDLSKRSEELRLKSEMTTSRTKSIEFAQESKALLREVGRIEIQLRVLHRELKHQEEHKGVFDSVVSFFKWLFTF